MPRPPLNADKQTRLGGILYLIIMAAGLFSEGYVRGSLVVGQDAAATAHNILAHEELYRLGGALEFVTLICDVCVAFILYNLLKPFSETLALLAAFFRLMFAAIYGVISVTHFAPLLLLHGAAGLSSFPPGQRQALALFSLKLHTVGYSISLVFFGVHCLLIGGLIAASRLFPRAIGFLLAIAGACYLVDSFASFIAPAVRAQLFPWFLLPGFVAEAALALWMTIRGLNMPRWNRLAHVGADGASTKGSEAQLQK